MFKKRSLPLICAAAFVFVLSFLIYQYITDDIHPEKAKAAYEAYMENEELLNSEDGGVFYPEEEAEQLEAVQTQKTGYGIFINLDVHTMYIYKGEELVKTYPISGGSSRTPSPLGKWKIISKDTWGEGFGGAWLGFNVPWGMYGIHGTREPWAVGKSNTSKGCIRMLNKDVRELYKMIPYGTPVTIVHTNRTFRSLRSGDIGSDVKEAQLALQKLGYYKGGADGKYGSVLKNSVKKFQKDHRLYANGVINKQVYNLIQSELQLMPG